eukprot:CAMPEP_0201187936 /NCGR_PEP_ID=MMETSP0851-20130426/134405_1 /ASSEMBLY_ACC=CAM_ASM_000631 /TAXON_ID=183588 /ORGANISM="Pseudo-nitzschia fraudulenta, Strain WWA7" /LENGTH=144 /DNA_ID=CAMNT_0047473483 /DNA_START=241 /DNA_END=672 /DNA_ORIENTATION=+
MNHKFGTPPGQRDNGRSDACKPTAALADPPTPPTPRAHLEGSGPPAAGATVRSRGALSRPIAAEGITPPGDNINIAATTAGAPTVAPQSAIECCRRVRCCDGEWSPSLLPRCSTSVRSTALPSTNASEGATAFWCLDTTAEPPP